MAKLAILQMGDTPQIESTALMLRAAGYTDVKVCGKALRDELQRAGLDTVISVQSMIDMGYDALDPSISEAYPCDMDHCDLFCEIKVRNVPKLLERWPRLKGRVLWWRVNGAQPEVCPKGGDEVNRPCPIATACLWYGLDRYRFPNKDQAAAVHEHGANRPITLLEQTQWTSKVRLHDTESSAYVFWPPYPRMAEYTRIARHGIPAGGFNLPFCIAHSGRAWGYGPIIDDCVKLGVKVYGNNSPHGQISHKDVRVLTSSGLALVHLKSVDCPGWALYEAMLSGCPVVTGRLLNSRMLAYGLLEDGKTCMEFGVPAQLEYGRGDMDYARCLSDIKWNLDMLKYPAANRYIGENGRQRLLSLMWNEERDGASFKTFMERNFR